MPEGVRIVTCPYCDMRSLVQGDRGVRRWQVSSRLERPQALEVVKTFFSGLNKARDLKRQAQINDLFLVYLPYWRVTAFVVATSASRHSSNIRRSRDASRTRSAKPCGLPFLAPFPVAVVSFLSCGTGCVKVYE